MVKQEWKIIEHDVYVVQKNEKKKLMLIAGEYFDGKQNLKGLGLHWNDFPAAPIPITKDLGNAFLYGLLQKAMLDNNQELIKKINEVMEYLDTK